MFGIEHSNFRFRFAVKILPLYNLENEFDDMMLQLTGFPSGDAVMTNGWKVKPLHEPPLVSNA